MLSFYWEVFYCQEFISLLNVTSIYLLLFNCGFGGAKISRIFVFRFLFHHFQHCRVALVACFRCVTRNFKSFIKQGGTALVRGWMHVSHLYNFMCSTGPPSWQAILNCCVFYQKLFFSTAVLLQGTHGFVKPRV